jgi:DNA-binding response OmpR family regulator
MTTSPARAAALRPLILIVDDERRNRQLLEVMLGGEGYDLISAESGRDALDKVRERAPDLILLDVMMPGMNGYEVATSVKEDPRTRHIPIIILTALDDKSSRIHGLSAGAEEFITKPLNRHDVCERVRNLLRRMTGTPPLET